MKCFKTFKMGDRWYLLIEATHRAAEPKKDIKFVKVGSRKP